MKHGLYKTTIVIWSEFDPRGDYEIEDLAREATNGSMFCSEQTTTYVNKDTGQLPNTDVFDEFKAKAS